MSSSKAKGLKRVGGQTRLGFVLWLRVLLGIIKEPFFLRKFLGWNRQTPNWEQISRLKVRNSRASCLALVLAREITKYIYFTSLQLINFISIIFKFIFANRNSSALPPQYRLVKDLSHFRKNSRTRKQSPSCWGSLFGTVPKLWAGWCGVRIPVGVREFSLFFRNVLICTGAHTAPFAVGIGISFPCVARPGGWYCRY